MKELNRTNKAVAFDKQLLLNLRKNNLQKIFSQGVKIFGVYEEHIQYFCAHCSTEI